MAAIVIINLMFWKPAAPVSQAITISLAGYTNLPGDPERFAILIVSNQAPYAIRLRDDWVEIKGNPAHFARVFSPKLPFTVHFNPILDPRHSLTMAVGEPGNLTETDRWRYTMPYVPETAKQWWLNHCFRDGWPTKIGPFWLVDAEQLLNPSNNINASGQWLGK